MAYQTEIGLNNPLVKQATITWNGEKLADNVLVPIGNNRPVMIVVDNSGNDSQDTTMTLEYLMPYGSSVYAAANVAAGTAISIAVTKSTCKAFGPFEGFPLFSGGKVVLTAASAPADTKTSIVSVYEL